MPIRVALINDFEIVLHGLASMLSPFEEVEVVEIDLQQTPEIPVDIALIDSFGRSEDVIDYAKTVIDSGSAGKVVIFTWSCSDDFIARAAAAGVAECLMKSLSAHDLVQALISIHNNQSVPKPAVEGISIASQGRWPGEQYGLTERESETLALIVNGYSNKEISDSLYLSPNSVKTHIRRIYDKLGINSRARAVLWGIQNGFSTTSTEDSEAS